ncbi:hypothetical protein ACFX13_035354 [Malus domestica]
MLLHPSLRVPHLHSGHHDQNWRRTSMTAVKRLADREARRLAPPQACHFGHHDQNQRRISMTVVKRLADHEARRLTFCLKLQLLLHLRHGYCCL